MIRIIKATRMASEAINQDIFQNGGCIYISTVFTCCGQWLFAEYNFIWTECLPPDKFVSVIGVCSDNSFQLVSLPSSDRQAKRFSSGSVKLMVLKTIVRLFCAYFNRIRSVYNWNTESRVVIFSMNNPGETFGEEEISGLKEISLCLAPI